MSELKTNQIATNDGNNVAIDNSLNLKSYSTTDRNALTSAAGDVIYNSTDNKVQVYTGSAWENLGVSTFTMDYLVIGAGGGGGSSYGGGGGAGGYRASYNSEASGGGGSSETALTLTKGINYLVSIGAGGAGRSGNSSSDGTANTGGGGGNRYNVTSHSGGSGVVILRWTTADATIGGTRTGLTDGDVQTDGSSSYIVFTAGEGTITFT